jgi:hypothetical protein
MIPPEVVFKVCHGRVVQFQAQQAALRVIRADASTHGGPARVGNIQTEYIADFYRAGHRAITYQGLPPDILKRIRYYPKGGPKKRLAIFRAYFMLFPPRAAFDSEITNADLLNEHAKMVMKAMNIREGTFWPLVFDLERDVGRELLRAKLFPPRDYTKITEVEVFEDEPFEPQRFISEEEQAELLEIDFRETMEL